MTANFGHAPGAGARLASSPWSRVYGFGSIYAKTLRDSRLSFLIMAGLLGGVMFAVGAAIPGLFATAAARAEVVTLANDIGAVASGIAGKPVNVGTMGGYVQWKYGAVFTIIASLWSILALSGTLATEARRGSLEFVAIAPFGKRRIAMEKLAAHVTVMTAVIIILALAAWLAGAAFATLPGDEIPVQAAVGFALGIGLIGLCFGGIAFALAPFVGRASAAAIAGAALFVGWITNGYAVTIPALGPIASLTPWGWTANHLPLAGQYDWPTLVPTALAAIVLLALGVEAFARRDLGASTSLRTPGLPAVTLGLGGPAARAFGERLPLALGWGLGLGAFGFLMAAISRSLADEVAKSPDIARTISTLFPSFDITSAGGFIQLLVQLLYIMVGFAAATFVSGWAADESSGRLEVLLTTPLTRSAWAIRSSVGAYGAIAVMTGIVAVAVGIGAVAAGSDALTPMVGTAVLGIYAAGLAGLGFAIGGFRSSIAAEMVALVVIVTYLIDLLAPALRLPDWVDQLAVTSHLGQPMVGTWDPAGIAVCLILAVGGLVVSGWGIRRRDVNA